MARFLELYVHQPLADLLAQIPDDLTQLPELRLTFRETEIHIAVGKDAPLIIERAMPEGDALPLEE
jgi:hypothetical protein